MQVILKKDVDHLGYAGDVVEVRKGYWRNYLRPRQLADQATAAVVQQLTQRMERRRAAEARNEGEAAELRDLINRTVLTIKANAGPQGKLYGSVTPAEIARSLDAARKLRIDPKKIKLDEPIRALGTFMVPVEVFSGVVAEMKTMVVQSDVVLSDAEIASREAREAEALAAADAAEAEAAAAAAAAEGAAAGDGDAGDAADATAAEGAAADTAAEGAAAESASVESPDEETAATGAGE